MKVTTHELRLVPIADLVIDAMAQREYSKARVNRILSVGYDEVLAGALIVGADPHDGKLYLIDGQTRMRSAEASGYEEILCLVWNSIDRQARARLFVLVNRDRSRVDQFDLHRVGIVAGFEEDTNIEDVLRSRGLEAGRRSGDRVIGGIAGLKTAYRRWGREITEQMLDTVMAAWPAYGAERWQPDLFQGIAINIGMNVTTLQPERYIAKLRDHDPWWWKGRLAQVTAGPGGSQGRPRYAAKMFAQAYNVGLRGGRAGIPPLKGSEIGRAHV